MDSQEDPMPAALTANDGSDLSRFQGQLDTHAETLRLERLVSAAQKGGLAILGQALFAGANFLANVLLARWLAPEQYGAFALAYACCLLFMMIYSACVYEPLIVLGSGRYSRQFREYFGQLIRGNFYVLIFLSGLMLAAALLMSILFAGGLAQDFMALSLATPFILVTLLGRGGFYAQLKQREAASGGAFYFLTLAAVLALLRLAGRLSGATAFLGMGAAGFASSAYLFSRLGCSWRDTSDHLKLIDVVREHWGYGRWALAAAVVWWFHQNIYYAVLPGRFGLEGAAALRALTNLIMPVVHSLIALATVLVPLLVRHHQQGGMAKMRKTMQSLTLLLIPGSLGYLAVLWSCRSVIFQSLYSGKYEQYDGWPLFLTALTPIALTVAMIVGSALRALRQPESIFWSFTAATVTAVIVGLPLTVYGGVIGATGALLISNVAAAIAMIWIFRRRVAEKARELQQMY